MMKLRNIAALATALLLALTLCVPAFGETPSWGSLAADISAAQRRRGQGDAVILGGLHRVKAVIFLILPLHVGLQPGEIPGVVVGGTGTGHGQRHPVGHGASGGEDVLRQQGRSVVYAALRPLGGDPTAFGTKPDGTAIDLVAEGTYNWQGDDLGGQGINGWLFALLTVDAVGAEVPADARYSRQDMIDAIVSVQLPDGGFALGGSAMDVDITAMALQALAPYREQYPEVIDAALSALSAAQLPDGGYESWGAQSSESCAQVILALCALDVDPETDERFQKGEGNVADALLAFRLSDGGFAHELDGQLDAMACEQAMQALTAMALRQQGEGRFFDLADTHPVQLDGAGDTAPAGTPAESGGSFPVLPVVLIVIAVAAVALVLVLKKKRENNV